jgi:3-carboxy-cis,cis-muconate cycloisomerase
VSDLFWPGAERAGGLLDQESWLAAMVAVEQAWSDALADAGIAPASPVLTDLVGPGDLTRLAVDAESCGNPVIGLVALLRSRAGGLGAEWVHRGLTSQDVLDTALVRCLRDAVSRLRAEIATQVGALTDLIRAHRDTLLTGRTLTQPATPVTLGLRAASWLSGVLDAADDLTALTFPVQLGGAAGTLAAVVELTGGDVVAARGLAVDTARRLQLAPTPPWHTNRRPLTRIGDALVACTDAWGHLANDVLIGSRPELGELAEPAGGGSSTLPHKRNPILSALVTRAAITAPALASTLHLAAAASAEERAAGAWHAEWATLSTLARRTVTAAAQTSELLAGLRVDPERMAAHAHTRWADLTAERTAIAEFRAAPPSAGEYLGAATAFTDTALDRARTWLETHR